jgi:hypothetical protein
MFVAGGTGTVGLLIYAKSPTHSTITSGRPPVCTGGVVGLPLLSTPSALADPALTASEAKYVAMLAQGPSGYGGIRAAPGRTDYDLAQGGHLIANDLRQGVGLEQEVLNVYGSGDSLWLIQARWMVYWAVQLFAPEFLPAIRDRSNAWQF